MASLDFNLPGAPGLTNLNVQGYMVHRVFATSFGTDRKNQDQITITNSTQTITFNRIDAEENTSHGAVYLVPDNQELVVSTIDITAHGQEGLIRLNEYDYEQGVRYSIGNFEVDSQRANYQYNVNGLIPARNGIVIDFIPKAGSPVLATFINVMANGVLCPIPDTFTFS